MLNIIIPIYRSRATLPKTLDSLVAQTKSLFFVTLVQDGDGENYDDIIEEYARRGLQLNLLVMPENGGPGNARQYAIDRSQMFEHLMFLDSDDMLMPRAVEMLTREMKLHNYDVCASGFLVEEAHTPGGFCEVDKTPVTWVLGKIYKRAYLVEKNIRFDLELRLNEDSYFNLVVFNSTENKGRIPEMLGLMRDNPNSLTRSDRGVGFLRKSADQYIMSQARGLLKISELVEEMSPELVAMTFLNMYDHMMRAIHFKIETPKGINDLAHLRWDSKIMKCLDTEEFWNLIQRQLRAVDRVDNEFFFYKMRFIDWLNKYIRGIDE